MYTIAVYEWDANNDRDRTIEDPEGHTDFVT